MSPQYRPKRMVKKILFITLSNIGDVILTLPLLDRLRSNYPQAEFTVMVGPRPKEIFENNPYISRAIVYDKHARLANKIKLFRELNRQGFDIVIDLRNSFYGAFLRAKYRTSYFWPLPKTITHMKDRHLYRAKHLRLNEQKSVRPIKSLNITRQDEEYLDRILLDNRIREDQSFIVIAPGARSDIKRWPQEKFIGLATLIIEKLGYKVILVGDQDDCNLAESIAKKVKTGIINLCAQTSISQLGAVLKRSRLLVSNDSAVLHLASYLDIGIVAIFGPTNQCKYGPWSKRQRSVYKNIFCRPCEAAQCKFSTLECMKLIKVEDVFGELKQLLETESPAQDRAIKDEIKRILIVRTDRIGDVLLSTPAIKALRDKFPPAYIAMVVRPYTAEIVRGNPFIDELIIYDKYGTEKSWLASFRFALRLKKKKFDLAVVLHPTNRMHLITFFAGIKRRIGFDKKLGFLLSDRVKHAKQLGERHELEYSLDLVRYLGCEIKDKRLFMPISQDSELWLEALFKRLAIPLEDRVLAVHPGASCRSKIWPAERFAQVCDRLIDKYGFKVIVLGAEKDKSIARSLIDNMRNPAINLAGQTSLSQLASLLKRAVLFISNDSGPVHLACAVETPVISIFGRNQKGLSPLRWGPQGAKDRVVHKQVGCIECLAHNCVKNFACLRAITVQDVLEAAELTLNS